MDDLIIIGNIFTLMTKLLACLQSHFPIKDLESLNYFLVIKASQSKGGLLIIQQKYIVDLLNKVGMIKYKPMPTLISNPKEVVTPAKLPAFSDPSLFR